MKLALPRFLCLAFAFAAAGVSPAMSAELPPLATIGEGALVSGELIYSLEDKPTPQCHASTLVETPNGLVAAWFGGSHEKNPDVGIWVSRQEGSAWSTPVEVVNGVQSAELRYPCWNPVLFQPSKGPLLLFYKVGPSPSTWWGMLMQSSDHGKTWSKPRKLGEDKALGEPNTQLAGPVKNKPIELSDGSILAPSSSEHDGWRVHFERSTDGGNTWEVIGPINSGKHFAAIQPSILRHPDNVLQILCRTRQDVVGESWSRDGGKTWSEITATGLPNPNSGTDALTLADGRHLIVYNHTTRLGNFPSNRGMLNVAVSTNGKSWTPVLTLERERGEFSYPAVIQTANGKVHISYTYQRRSVKHVVVDPTKIP